ncbi:hypothetical protein AJ88_11275 [Mesorhizobium amorphae CCBAU 01583]|nr:hypothetical protein AJ88_11275 [Mesorhizobium amorphae CCBAU 01583]
MIWSPDSAVLFGPAPELLNYFCCNGIIPGFSQSGGMGKLAAEWMIEGEPSLDMFAWDMARFGHWAGKAFTKARVQDQYSHRFKIHFPNEERAAGRPVRTRPAYDMQKQMGAVFGLNLAGSTRSGSPPRASRTRRRSASPARTGGDRSDARRACCASMPASSTFRTSPNTRSWDRAPKPGSTRCSPTACRRKSAAPASPR